MEPTASEDPPVSVPPPSAATNDTPGEPADSGTAYTLTANNGSTVPGNQYFNVFPLPMTLKPNQPQTVVPLVSSATVTGGGAAATTVMTWTGGADTLALIALTAGQSSVGAPQTPVALGDTATVTWENNAFTISTATGGTDGTITVSFSPGIPAGSQIGLMVAPGLILTPVPAAGGSLTLTPDLSPVVRVQFGTAYQSGQPNATDNSRMATVSLSASGAQISVGLDNVIVQTS